MKTHLVPIGLIVVIAGMLSSALPLRSAELDSANQNALAAKLKEWQAMRYGMFIHWNPVSLKGTEIGWSRGSQIPVDEYDQLYKQFNPDQFNADEWVTVAKGAGMKYIVFTSKHHDGFCMWDTQQTDFNIMHSPYGKDVLKDLSEACKRQGLSFSTYHSVCDWHHPDFPRTSPGGRKRREVSNIDRYDQYLRAQVKELITEYGPLQTMWFDVPQEFDETRGLALEAWTRSLQPDIIINNRSGAKGDYDTPEQRVGNYQDDRPWETCMTICQQWAWKPNDDMKTLKDCLHNLVRCAGGDGNLLFNVGPMPDGRIEPRQVERLKEIGRWLEKHGESIYGTRGGPWKPTKSVASTRKGNLVFLHVLRWDGEFLELPDIDRKVVNTSIMGGGIAEVSQANGTLKVSVRPNQRDPVNTVIQLEFDAPVMDLPAVALGLSVNAEASNIYQNQIHHFGAEMAFDDDNETRWATDAGIQQAWIKCDLVKPRTIQRIRIEEAMGQRIQAFEFQYRKDGKWKNLFAGGTIGRWFQKKLDHPVNAREFRLHILEASDGPTIVDIEFFE